jgi:hypothetical protein
VISTASPKTTPMDLLNCVVKFRKRDVFLPEPREVLLELHGDEFIKGKIVGFSDSGSMRQEFAIIEVTGLARPLMVRVQQVTHVPEPSGTSRNRGNL